MKASGYVCECWVKTKSGEQFAVVMKYGQSQINVIFLQLDTLACWDEVRWDCNLDRTLQNMIKWKKNIQPMNEINPASSYKLL